MADKENGGGRGAKCRNKVKLQAEGAQAAGGGAAPSPAAGAAASAAEGPDFSGDSSPSVAPQEKTKRPKRRPDADE